MRRTITASLVVALLALAGCGDDDDDQDTPETLPGGASLPEGVTVPSLPDITVPEGVTVPSLPEITIPEITIPDISIPELSLPDLSLPDAGEIEEQIRDGLSQAGLDDEQIDCLLERVDIGSGEVPALDDFMALFAECNIDITDLGG